MARGKILQTVIDISGEISPTLGKSLDEVGKKLEGVNLKAIAAGAAVGGIAVGTVAAVGKAVVGLAKLGDEYNTAVNDIAAGTGLVGEELEGMSDVLKDVYGSNFGESMEDAAAGITEVYRATGLTDEALAETTKAAYALSDTFGYEVAESARAARAMMQNFGVTGEEAMGLIAAGAQNGLDYSGELIDSVNEYSVQFAKLGFSADDMFNIFAAGAENGAWNLDKVGDAVKEFSIRSIDGSKGTMEAYTALGLNAEETMATFAKGGEDAEKAFKDVTKRLISLDDQVERDALGVALFGTQWEDLGVDAVAALANVQDEAYNTEDALGKINKVKYNNLGDAFEGIKRQAEVALLPLAQTIADVLLDIAPIITDLFEELGPVISDLTSQLAPLIKDIMGQLMPVLKEITPIISEICKELLPILAEIITMVFDAIGPILPMLAELVRNLLPLVVSLLDAIVPIIQMLFDVLGPVIEIVVQLLNQILPPLTSLIDALIPIITFLAQTIGAVLGGALDAIAPLLTGLMDILSGIIDFITNIFTGNWEGAWQAVVDVFKGIFNLIPQTVETVINSVIGVVNGIIEGINSVSGWIGITIPLIPLVELPRFAEGGFTEGISIAGEAGTEAVISFDPAYRKENIAYWAKAGRMLGADVSDYFLGCTSHSGTDIDFGGITFAPNITITGSADKETVMKAIEDEYPEFLDMLEAYLVERGRLIYA